AALGVPTYRGGTIFRRSSAGHREERLEVVEHGAAVDVGEVAPARHRLAVAARVERANQAFTRRLNARARMRRKEPAREVGRMDRLRVRGRSVAVPARAVTARA